MSTASPPALEEKSNEPQPAGLPTAEVRPATFALGDQGRRRVARRAFSHPDVPARRLPAQGCRHLLASCGRAI